MRLKRIGAFGKPSRITRGNGVASQFDVLRAQTQRDNNQQALITQCAAAVQQRLSGGGYSGYGFNNAYGGGYGGGRVLGVSRIEPRAGGGLTVRGVASSGRYAGYGYGAQAPVDLTWKCKIDYRGLISDISVDRAQGNYGYNGYNGANAYTPYNQDYSQYGYRRY